MSFDFQAPFKKKPQIPVTEKPTDRRDPPHIPSINAVVEFIQERFPGKAHDQTRRQLCADALSCTPWSVEPFLLKELVQAKIKQDPQAIEKIRKLMRATSWQEHKQLPLKNLINISREFIGRIEKETANLSDPEYGLDQRQAATSIKETLEQKLQGADALTACEAIENALINTYRQYEHVTLEGKKPQRERLVKQLHNLRILRDQLYYQALFAGWYLPQTPNA